MPKSRALNQWVCFLPCRSLDALFTCNSSTNSEPMRLPSLCMQALGLGYFTVCTNRAAEQSIHSDINLLRNSGAWSGGARAPHILCVCSGRCAPLSPAPKPLATISVAMYTNRLWLKTSPQAATAFPVKRKTLLNLRFIGFDHTRVRYAHQ